jgi:nucleotide-binding universal stress UspA family protein
LSLEAEVPFIVVGIDDDPRHRHHLIWAAEEALRWGAHLVVLHVTEGVSGSIVASSGGVVRTESQLLLERDVATAMAFGVETEGRLLEGAPSNRLVEAAQGAAMLILGSRHRGVIAGAVHNSLATHCIHHAPCPVLVVPNRSPLASRQEDAPVSIQSVPPSGRES